MSMQLQVVEADNETEVVISNAVTIFIVDPEDCRWTHSLTHRDLCITHDNALLS